MKIGILGTGIGTYHIELYQLFDEVEEIKICGRNEDKLQDIYKKYNVQTTTNINDILKDDTIDLVDICLPSTLHKDYIIKALQNDKHVFCETPLTSSMEDIIAIKEAQNKYQKNVFINLFIKFSEAHQILQKAIKNNSYGKLKSLYLTRKTPAIWGDLGLNHIATQLMLHEVDFITECLGLPTKIKARGFSSKEETAYVLAELEYNQLVVELKGISMMPDYYPFLVSFEAVFENGVLEYSDKDTISGEEMSLIEYTNNHKKEIELSSDTSFEKTFQYVIENYNKIGNHKLSVDDASKTLNITLAIQKQLIKTSV
ncbi:Gfo/Idh/MocA family oxidoreductase [Mycoplasmatota bacterium]|nr:Gfo/Idh/MocA family oxidoreductase [Mycoplasmatota bacterium]